MHEFVDLLRWSGWRSFRCASRDPEIPRAPGLYRIRQVGQDNPDYIGQTGGSLRRRLGMLSGIYDDVMPYADPHTAAPALWALPHSTGCEFEVSVATVNGSTPWRKGLEAVAIALYRQEHKQSPTVEFGRMPVGYWPSSGNNSRLVTAGKRCRGGVSNAPHERHQPGIAPFATLEGDPHAATWCGHAWTSWVSLREVGRHGVERGSGLYRIRGGEMDSLLYVGQGRIPNRLLAHLAKTRDADNEQGRIFASHERLECSWTINDAWLPHQRLELENDLIAAYVLETGSIPAAQFLG